LPSTEQEKRFITKLAFNDARKHVRALRGRKPRKFLAVWELRTNQETPHTLLLPSKHGSGKLGIPNVVKRMFRESILKSLFSGRIRPKLIEMFNRIFAVNRPSLMISGCAGKPIYRRDWKRVVVFSRKRTKAGKPVNRVRHRQLT